MMGTITIGVTEDVFLGSLQLTWLSVRADGRTEVFARGQHLAFHLEPPPTQEGSPLVLITRAVAEAARIENHGIPPRLPAERRSAYLDHLADLDQVEERRQADIEALSLADKEPDVPPDPTGKIEQQPGASKAMVDDDLYQLQRDMDETDEDYGSRCRMLGCDAGGFTRLPRRRPTDCLVPCMICGKPLQDESAGNNQPIGGRAFQCGGHWPSAIFDAEPGWLEIKICEPCPHSAVERRRSCSATAQAGVSQPTGYGIGRTESEISFRKEKRSDYHRAARRESLRYAGSFPDGSYPSREPLRPPPVWTGIRYRSLRLSRNRPPTACTTTTVAAAAHREAPEPISCRRH